MKPINSVPSGNCNLKKATSNRDCPARVGTKGMTFRPVRAGGKRLLAAGRKGDRFRVNLTPELLWHSSGYDVEIKRPAPSG